MSPVWLEILRREVNSRGAAQVARELGVSTTTVSLVLNHKYNASTDKVQEKIQRIYGEGGHINCQALGDITPAQCVDQWERAHRVGSKCGNPATIRLHLACKKCDLRNK